MLGAAAMLLSFDVAAEAIPEHDDWHTHEHLPERLSIPGFLRGSRWVAIRAPSRYLVLYEVAEIATLTSAAYLQRLDQPSPWTSRMMPHYRGMKRGLCNVLASCGLGIGNVAYVVWFKARDDDALLDWLLESLPALVSLRGIGSARLLQTAVAAQMTNEQRIRGADAGFDSAVVLMGYEEDALSAAARDLLGPPHLHNRGASGAIDGLYRFDYALTSADAAR
jgi:hypothetical protein